MSNPNSGDKPPDEPAKDNQLRPLNIPSTKPTMPSITRANAPFQGMTGMSKSLSSRPVLVPGVIPPAAHTAQQLQAILPAAGLLPSSIDASKSPSQNLLNFSNLTQPSTGSMLSSTQIVKVATPGASQPSIVQISAPTPVTSTSHVTDGSMLKHVSNFTSHLPKGAAAAASVLSAPKSNTAVPIMRPGHHAMQSSSSATGIHAARGSLISTTPIRTTHPPTTRAISSAVSIASSLPDTHRQIKTIPSTTASIQITVQPTRTSTEVSKQIIAHQQSVQKLHLPHGLQANKLLSSQQALTQQSVLGLTKTNKALPVATTASFSAVSLGGLSVSNAPIQSINSLNAAAASIIPVAKVNPVRQQQPASLSSHLPGRTSGPTTTQDSSRTEPSSHSTPVHTLPHSQQSQFLPPGHRTVTTPMSLPGSVTAADTRAATPLNLSFQYMISPEYQQLMYQHMVSSASTLRPAVNPNLLAAVHAGMITNNQPLVDTSMLMRQQPNINLYTSQNVNSNFSTSSEAAVRSTTPKDVTSVSLPTTSVVMTTAVPVPALSAIAMTNSNISNLATASNNLYINATQAPGITVPQYQTTQHSQPTNIPVTNANSSPRPSILRKRTNEGITVVKKPVCGLNSTQEKLPDRNSPRPDSRTDSAPQSNTSSPKTPATPAGESQSSTDTALSSEATTPTQNALSDLRIKQEPPDTIENGFTNSNSLPNSTETSPRKKPRKQLLHVNQELKDSSSSDDDDFDDDKLVMKDEDFEIKDEYFDDEGVRWTLEKTKPNISLMNFYNISWKSRNNHFQRYTDVKPKDERRPTVNELSNQRGIAQKASGWKLYHMAAQMEDLICLEKALHEKVLSIQESIAPQPVRQHAPEDDSGLLHELTQANLQRSKLIEDQLEEAKSSMLKVLDHKSKIFEIINKHMSKRPIKKKERS